MTSTRILRGLGSDAGGEAFWTQPVVWILSLCFDRKDEELVTGIVQAIHEPACGAICMSAPTDLHETVLDAHRHTLIEDETLALPMLVSELFLISDDAAM